MASTRCAQRPQVVQHRQAMPSQPPSHTGVERQSGYLIATLHTRLAARIGARASLQHRSARVGRARRRAALRTVRGPRAWALPCNTTVGTAAER